MKPFARQLGIVFGLWTLIAILGGAADYLFRYATGGEPAWWTVFRRPLTEQWIWAGLTPLVFLTARRFPLRRPGLPLAFSVHAVCFLLLSLLHCALADALGSPLGSIPPHYHGSVLELRFLKELYSDIWMYWPLVVIQALIDSYARARERDRLAARLEAELTKSRLALLRAQIQPHFLFNTLHAIAALTRIDVRAAEDMVADLAELLRASFSDPTLQETSLRRELELIRCYLRIQTRRFGDRLSVSYRVASDTLDASVPALVLQSLVENAVIHGIAPMDRKCRLEIHAQRLADRLVLRVVDDGAGLRTPYRPGVGLSNATNRLRQLYGNRQFLELVGRPDHGVRVTVSIPLRMLDRDLQEGGTVDHENTDADRGRRGPGTPEPVVAAGS